MKVPFEVGHSGAGAALVEKNGPVVPPLMEPGLQLFFNLTETAGTAIGALLSGVGVVELIEAMYRELLTIAEPAFEALWQWGVAHASPDVRPMLHGMRLVAQLARR